MPLTVKRTKITSKAIGIFISKNLFKFHKILRIIGLKHSYFDSR